jgi:hypothetical protein
MLLKHESEHNASQLLFFKKEDSCLFSLRHKVAQAPKTIFDSFNSVWRVVYQDILHH